MIWRADPLTRLNLKIFSLGFLNDLIYLSWLSSYLISFEDTWVERVNPGGSGSGGETFDGGCQDHPDALGLCSNPNSLGRSGSLRPCGFGYPALDRH
jgi:hypothetical protein